ncbi:MAG TPA: hypothetical protein PLQ39_13340, partial [Acinetobacter sp.]|nr:hypothetical protein [Acinetobacter sp.]
RVRKGEEIVYKKPDAIERAKQDSRYQVEINDKGHAVVKNIKDLNGEWVKKDELIAAEATHIENGKIEEVTPEIIRESLAKVDDKPVNGKTMSLKEAKQWLLDQVTTAIAISPSNKLDYKADSLIEAIKWLDTPRDRAENKDQINAAKKELESYYITFDVPNDGVFKVLNNVESLQKFKKKVEANRGFDKQSPKKPSSPSEIDAQSAETTIKEFFTDQELDNAYEYSKLKGKPMRFGMSNKGVVLPYALTETFTVSGTEFVVGLSAQKEQTGANTYGYQWRVLEPSSGFAVGRSQKTKKEAIDAATKAITEQMKGDNFANAVKRAKNGDNYLSENEREQKWLESIGHNTSDDIAAQKPQNINKKSAAIENLYDLALGAAKATQIKADRDKNKPVDFAANTFEDKWQKAINGDAKAIKDIRDYFVNTKRV